MSYGTGAWGSSFELREAIHRGEVSARELITDALERASTNELGAFISLNPDLALAEADAADQLIAGTPASQRTALPPLLGVPTAHKDLVEVRGTVTTWGSRAVPHSVADSDAPIAAAVRSAGGISIGKTQVPEFGLTGYSENDISAPARNPHDHGLTAGGSSGGTAAAIAGGVITGAIGSDAGGSIRIPSAACGLIGLKPGRGRIPADARSDAATVNPLGIPAMSVSGPMATSALDAALWLDAVCGERAEPSVAAVRAAGDLVGLRIGVSFTSPFAGWIPITHSPEATSAVTLAVARLAARDHRLAEASITYDSRYPAAFTTVWTQALTRIGLSASAEKLLGDLAQMFLRRARSNSEADVRAAIAALAEFADDAARQWAHYDVVLTPALAGAPPAVGAFRGLGPEGDYRLQCEWAPQTSMVNVVGVPAIVVPVEGAAPESPLPYGVQLIGRAGSEAQLLQLAEQLLHE